MENNNSNNNSHIAILLSGISVNVFLILMFLIYNSLPVGDSDFSLSMYIAKNYPFLMRTPSRWVMLASMMIGVVSMPFIYIYEQSTNLFDDFHPIKVFFKTFGLVVITFIIFSIIDANIIV